MAPRRRIFWAGVLAPFVLLLTVVAAWAIDTGAAGGEVLRNVDIAGIDVVREPLQARDMLRALTSRPTSAG